MSEESLRGSLEAAMEKHAAPEAPAAAPVEAAAPIEAPETPAAEAAESSAPAAPEAPQAAAKPVAQPKPGQPATAPTEPVQATETPAAPKQADIRAPQSWRPGAREQWAKLPPEVQQEVVRREGEVQRLLQESSEHRKVAQSFQQVVSPYMGMIQAEGQDPVKAVAGLLQTAAALRTAPPAHKAQLVAQIIDGYGVPLEAINAVLAGQAPPAAEAQPQQFDPNQLLQQAEQRIMQRFSQQAQQSRVSGATRQVQEFISSGKAEFFEDVRPQMKALLAAAAEDKVELSLEEAYNRAVWSNPELRKVLQQREQAAQATATQAATQRATRAASSVKSTPAVATAPKDDSLRGTLESAWANSSGR